MINSVIDSVKSYKTSDYNPFNKDSGAYYITKQTLEDIYESNKKKEVQRNKALGFLIGNIALFSASGAFALFKGLPSGTYKKLSKLGRKLEEKVADNGNSNKMQQIYGRMLKWTRTHAEKSKSVNNFTSFKDLLFKKLMSKTKFTAKIHDGITNFFEKLSRKTVNNKYRAFESSFADLGETLDKVTVKDAKKPITINGVTKTAGEWLEYTKQLRGSISEKVQLNFGAKAREARYKRMKQAVEGLEERVIEKSREGMSEGSKLQEKIKALKESDVSQSFIAEDCMAADKLNMGRTVGAMRSEVTQNIADNYRNSRNLIDNISKCIEPEDQPSKDTLKLLVEYLNTYKKLSGPMEVPLREQATEGIIKTLKIFTDSIQKSEVKYDKKVLKSILDSSKEIETTLTKGKKGDMQELLTIYKHLLPQNQYKKLRTQTDNVTKTLDKAISTEVDDFFDKLRDLKLGSAPTDMLTILTSLGGVGIGLGAAKDRDERISASLKYGIPAVGGIATALIMTSALVSGGKGMAAGLLSSFILGEMGDAADKFRKNYKEHKLAESQKTADNETVPEDKNNAEVKQEVISENKTETEAKA